MTRERRDKINACWLVGYSAFDAGMLLSGRTVTLRELLEISNLYQANENHLEQTSRCIAQHGAQFDRRIAR